MWVVILGVLIGVTAFFLKKPLLIVATSLGGAFAVVGSIEAMVGTLNIALTLPTTWQDWVGFLYPLKSTNVFGKQGRFWWNTWARGIRTFDSGLLHGTRTVIT